MAIYGWSIDKNVAAAHIREERVVMMDALRRSHRREMIEGGNRIINPRGDRDNIDAIMAGYEETLALLFSPTTSADNLLSEFYTDEPVFGTGNGFTFSIVMDADRNYYFGLRLSGEYTADQASALFSLPQTPDYLNLQIQAMLLGATSDLLLTIPTDD